MHAALKSGLFAEVERVRNLWCLDAELQPSRYEVVVGWCRHLRQLHKEASELLCACMQ